MPTLEVADAFLRIGAAGGCGALIGIERESRNQLAGIRRDQALEALPEVERCLIRKTPHYRDASASG